LASAGLRRLRCAVRRRGFDVAGLQCSGCAASGRWRTRPL